MDDFGIYNVVGGFVTMFSILSGALSNAISRFLTFELGRKDFDRLKEVFSTSVNVQILLAFSIVLIAETIGVWFLNTQMNIPTNRMVAANWVFQCSLLTFVVNLISVPYNASIIAHEKMTAFAYISILEVVLKLCIVVLLLFLTSDRLIIYGVLLMVLAIFIRVVYGAYCARHFEECHYGFTYNKKLVKEMIGLASWNFLGASGAILSGHGVNLLINMFFGVACNAARGIAAQVNNAVNQFVNSFTTALIPQITKSYASGNLPRMFNLVYMGTKFSYFLMFLVAFPLIVETPTILKLWLDIVPDYTVLFVRLTLIESLISILSTFLFTVAMATGDIKRYQMWVGSLSLSVFFMVYLLYYMGCSVEAAYFASIIIQILILVARIIILHGLIGLCVQTYCKVVLARVVIVSLTTVLIIYYVKNSIINFSFIANILFCICVVGSIVFFLGLNKSERCVAIRVLSQTIRKR